MSNPSLHRNVYSCDGTQTSLCQNSPFIQENITQGISSSRKNYHNIAKFPLGFFHFPLDQIERQMQPSQPALVYARRCCLLCPSVQLVAILCCHPATAPCLIIKAESKCARDEPVKIIKVDNWTTKQWPEEAAPNRLKGARLVSQGFLSANAACMCMLVPEFQPLCVHMYASLVCMFGFPSTA